MNAAWDGDGAPQAFRDPTNPKRAFQARVLVMLRDFVSGLGAAPTTAGASLLAAAAAGGLRGGQLIPNPDGGAEFFEDQYHPAPTRSRSATRS